MASEKPGYLLFLALILARCVRGQYGVPFVIKYIVTNWTKFTREFPAFCKNLVAAAEKYSKDMGRTHLAHRDGLATGFSGLQFLKTLKKRKREDLVAEMVAAGGNPRPYNAAGKQLRMTAAQISEWLSKKK